MNDKNTLASVHTSNFPEFLRQLHCSLVVTTYQAGRVILVRHDEIEQNGAMTGTLNTHFRPFDRPMGVCEKDGRLSIGGTNTVWEYRNVPAVSRQLEPPDQHDACYVPRRTHFTGNIDIHEMSWSGDDRLWLVNTRFSCLCTLDADNSFHPRWRPPFVSAYAPEDRCHLNGLAMRDGEPRYVTALGETDVMSGWRANKASGGLLMDIKGGDVLVRGLSMPHSPRWYRDKLWVLESGRGALSTIDLRSNEVTTVATLPGFTRGIDFVGPFAFIGLSKVRESATFSGIPIVKELTERICGVWVVHLDSGQVVGFLRFESGVEEIFGVQVLQGIEFPEMLMPDHPLINLTYVLPDEALSEVSLPTPEQLEATPQAFMARGMELFGRREFAQAAAAFRECLARQPGFPDARYDLGVALAEAGELSEALEVLRGVRADEPERSEVHLSLGTLLLRLGRYDEARESFETAITRDPHNVLAHVSLGVLLLQQGDYARGFEEYAWRSEMAVHGPHPVWEGQPAREQTLLVYAGDDPRHLVLLSRYLPIASQRVGQLIIVCPEACGALVATVPGVAEVRRPGDVKAAEFDMLVELASLPRLFRTTPGHVPTVDGVLDLAVLRRRGAKTGTVPGPGAIRVGLASRGVGDSSSLSADAASSRWEEMFAPLLAHADVTFYDLSDAGPATGVERPSNLHTMEGLAADAAPVELASAIADLDLVIGQDSVAVHLAGALGKPVWALVGAVSDWCWPIGIEGTPWYPTARIFREAAAGDASGQAALLHAAFDEWLRRSTSPAHDTSCVRGRGRATLG
jgi:uncharacterized protein (TIGR03032 family)